jgi:hypothetical protein
MRRCVEELKSYWRGPEEAAIENAAHAVQPNQRRMMAGAAGRQRRRPRFKILSLSTRESLHPCRHIFIAMRHTRIHNPVSLSTSRAARSPVCMAYCIALARLFGLFIERPMLPTSSAFFATVQWRSCAASGGTRYPRRSRSSLRGLPATGPSMSPHLYGEPVVPLDLRRGCSICLVAPAPSSLLVVENQRPAQL